MLDTAQYFINQAGKHLDLSKQDIDQLLKTDAEHQFEIELANQLLPAYRVQHNNRRGPYKGGIRFHPEVDLDEVRALATLMSMKTSALGLPLGGAKGGVVVSPSDLSRDELEEVSRKYVRHLHKHIGPDQDVPAPDVNTNPAIIDWMVDEYSLLTGDTTRASFTGKSLDNGGSLGRDAATGRGGVIATNEVLKHQKVKTNQALTYAVQGFGNVGSFFALTAQADHPNWRLLSASDSETGIYCKEGLDPKQLADFKENHGRFINFKADKIDNESLIGLEVDILVLAALGDAVTEANMRSVKARYVIEMANGPINAKAHEYLNDHGVMIVPDIIANAGGVVVSYLEWLQNKAGERWSEVKVNDQLKAYMVKAVTKTLDLAKTDKISLTEAAFVLAIKGLIA